MISFWISLFSCSQSILVDFWFVWWLDFLKKKHKKKLVSKFANIGGWQLPFCFWAFEFLNFGNGIPWNPLESFGILNFRINYFGYQGGCTIFAFFCRILLKGGSAKTFIKAFDLSVNELCLNCALILIQNSFQMNSNIFRILTFKYY